MASSDSLLQPPLKNHKTIKECSSDGIDMISRLPDDVICRILSFIPTKYSIRTSVLSKRWENLWTLSSKLLLGFDHCFIKDNSQAGIKFKDQCVNTFINSVEKLLFLRDCCPIENFKLYFRGTYLPPRLSSSSWICAVVMRNVRELDLTIEFNATDLGELPRCLYTCKTLAVLKLSGKFILNVPRYVCLQNLKTLLLKNVVYLGDSSIQKLLSGCPILEDLEIKRSEWDQMRTLNVDHSSLKRLKLDNSIPDEVMYKQGDVVDKIVVEAPNLESIDIEDSWSGDIIMKYFPNLVEAHINISVFEDTNKELVLSTLLQSMANVRRLYLSEDTLEMLWFIEDARLITFHNLVYLELNYDPSCGPIQLMNFLCSCPKLEALSLPGGIKCYDDDLGLDYEFWENDPEQVPDCLRHSLKTVEVQDFSGEEFELNIMRYLLGNALALKKISIVWRWPPTDVKFVEIQTKLTNYPRLSNECKLDLLYRR